MSKLQIRQGDWVIVCDGKKALMLENAGDEKFLNLKTREVLDHPDAKTHEIGTDAPGRSFSSVGSGRKSLIMVAPPRALGVLRQAYSHNLRAALRAEIDKDFVKLPVYEIEKHLAG